MYLKNTSGQKLEVFAFDYTTGAPKTGDAANLTAYVNIDEAGYGTLTDTSATEVDSTNKKGLYLFDLTQGETNGAKLAFFAKSSTANVSVIARPPVSFTQPATGILAPTVASRTLDVSAGGEAGVDWANVGSPTTSLALTGTTIATTQKVDLETIKTNPVVNAGTVTFPTTATLASTTNITAGTMTTTTNLTNAPSAGDFTATMKTSIGTAVAASAVASVTGNVGGNVTGSVGSVVGAVGSVTGAVGSVTGNVGGNVTGSVGSVTGLTASDVAAIKVITDALGATAAARLKLSAERIVTGTIDTAGFSPTTTEFEADDITEATADHYNGRIIIFTSGALVNQATSISDYSLATGRGHFTVVAMTEAPANNDTFIIV